MNNKNLTTVITAGKKIVKNNPVLQILGSVNFTPEYLSITNLKTTLKVYLNTGLNGCINTAQFLKALTIDPVLTQEGDKAIFKNGKKEVKVIIESNDDFPIFEIKDTKVVFSIPTVEILKASNLTSNDELRPQMMCVYVGNEYSANIEICGTDAHRLYMYDTKVLSETKFSTLINKDVISILKSLKVQDILIEVKDDYNLIGFYFEGVKCEIIQKTEGYKYPNYPNVMPTIQTYFGTYDKKELMTSIKESLNFANKYTKCVKIGEILIAEDADMGTEYKEELKFTGNPILKGYNGQFLIDILSLLDSKDVTFATESTTRATTMTEGNGTFLLMPVMVN